MLIKNCKIVDVRKGDILEGPVSVEGGVIASLGNVKEAGKDSIDLGGAYLLPGLITCHSHLGHVYPFFERVPESAAVTALRCASRGVVALHAGITTVRTTGTRHAADLDLRSMIRQGWLEGPRIVSAGNGISTTGGHGSGSSVLADGPEEFRKRAREMLVAGADHLKIFITGGIAQRKETFDEPQMSLEEIEAVVCVARSKNTYVVAHSGASAPIIKAAKAGVLSFEHGYLLDQESARVIAKNGGYLCPTLCVSRSPNWMKAHRFEDWTIKKALDAGKEHLESAATAISEGVRILNGTDIPPGDTDEGVNVVVKEMEYLVDAGLSPLGSIQATTLNPAGLMKIDKQVGTVEPGYQADLIAIRRNPLSDIRALRDIFFVMQAGRLVRWDHT